MSSELGFDRDINFDNLTSADLPKFVNAEDLRLFIAVERIEACNRLKMLAKLNFKSYPEDTPLDVALYTGYDFHNPELPELTRVQLLRNFIGFDLFLREMFNGDGTSSNFAEDIYPGINFNPLEYRVYGISWEAVREEIAQLSPDSPGSDYVGFISASDFRSDDPVERYSEQNGLGSIVTLPYAINIGAESISVSRIEDFTPPFGGHYYNDRLPFVLVPDTIITSNEV